ncbi:MAG: hypothetical protein ACI94Y_001862 [Maribacter sp.]|jgi:hypothetical protein
MKNQISFFFAVIILASCSSPTPSPVPDLPSEVFMQLFPTADNDSSTVFHFYNTEDEIATPFTDSLLRTALSDGMIEAIEYGTGDAKHQAKQKFDLDEKHLACIINSTESWFINQSLLTYVHETNSFRDAMTISQFYGGDGGQIVTESWIYTDNDKKYLYQIESSHAMIMTDDSGEPEKVIEEHSQLYIWTENVFTKIAQEDSLALAQRFQLKWEW